MRGLRKKKVRQRTLEEFLADIHGNNKHPLEFVERDKYNRNFIPDSAIILTPHVREGSTVKIPETAGDFEFIDVDGTVIKIGVDGKTIREGFFIGSAEEVKEETFLPFEGEIRNYLTSHIPFITSMLSGITFLKVPEELNVKEPVNILHIRGFENPTLSHLTILIAERNSKVRIFENYLPERKEGGSIIAGTFLYLMEGAEVEYCGLVPRNNTSLEIFVRKAILMEKSRLVFNHAWFGGSYLRGESYVEMRGKESRAQENHLFFSYLKNFYDFKSLLIHLGKNTRAESHVRGVLDGNSRAVFRAMGRIERSAQDAESYVEDHVLLLSEKARSDSIPALEILNNAVKASHSASSGNIDEEKLFYLQTRGMDEFSAKSLYIRGFFERIIRGCPREFTKRVIEDMENLMMGE